ncbi:transposable element Tc1 transposase [Trichonephila clavipes]|nr:transposable element Tc1 transposase [Trichonephila clavipes]
MASRLGKPSLSTRPKSVGGEHRASKSLKTSMYAGWNQQTSLEQGCQTRGQRAECGQPECCVCVSPDFLFMNDSVQPHRCVEVSVTFQSENILRMQWLAYSPDLYPIEHAWDALRRRVVQRTIPPSRVQDLKTAFRGEWDNTPPELLDSLVKIIENSGKMCISVRGQYTSY